MRIKIALLRGVNVGGKRKILMADLKALCEGLGYENVKTYIQSGNLIFNSNKPNAELENALELAITGRFGFKVSVIVRDSDELSAYIDSNPFIKDTSVDQLYLTILKGSPNKENEAELLTYSFEPDKFKMGDQAVYICCNGKNHQSKLTNNFFEKKLNIGATTRNWKTILKLMELSM